MSTITPSTHPPAVMEVANGLVRVIAPNPSPMTHWGTNSFLLGTGDARVLIDPGPRDAAHTAAILAALPDGAEITHILVTHAHLDHTGGVQDLRDATGAPVYAFGNAASGRSDIMETLAADPDLLGGGEGVDTTFAPDITLTDGERLHTPAGTITALHTPGHMSGHLSFVWDGHYFTGDLIMGWSSSLISPPDGCARAYRESLNRLHILSPARLFPAHGDAIDAPLTRISELLEHRAAREAQILATLAAGPQGLDSITRNVYPNLAPVALPYAARNTLAHLIDLFEQNRVSAKPKLARTATFSRL